MTALIVDDEPLARAHLRSLLEAQGVQVAGEAESAAMALQLTEEGAPDLLLLDIRMPGLSGMQLAGALLHLASPPLIIFVTGYSEHAVSAFEHDALDYLVKPVSAERLTKTLLRARDRLADRESRRLTEARVAERAAAAPPLRRLPVRGAYAIRLIRVDEIVFALARDKRVFVRTKEGEYRTYYTLTLLESLLPTDQFLRIHESYLVNLDAVEELLFLGNHTYAVRLATAHQVPVGRKHYAVLQRRLCLDAVSPS